LVKLKYFLNLTFTKEQVSSGYKLKFPPKIFNHYPYNLLSHHLAVGGLLHSFHRTKLDATLGAMFDATFDSSFDAMFDGKFDGKFDASFGATLRDGAPPNPPRVFARQCLTFLTLTTESNPTLSRQTTTG
jgi:hypothetical protein